MQSALDSVVSSSPSSAAGSSTPPQSSGRERAAAVLEALRPLMKRSDINKVKNAMNKFRAANSRDSPSSSSAAAAAGEDSLDVAAVKERFLNDLGRIRTGEKVQKTRPSEDQALLRSVFEGELGIVRREKDGGDKAEEARYTVEEVNSSKSEETAKVLLSLRRLARHCLGEEEKKPEGMSDPSSLSTSDASELSALVSLLNSSLPRNHLHLGPYTELLTKQYDHPQTQRPAVVMNHALRASRQIFSGHVGWVASPIADYLATPDFMKPEGATSSSWKHDADEDMVIARESWRFERRQGDDFTEQFLKVGAKFFSLMR